MTTAFQSNAFQNNGFQVDPVTGVLYAVDENDLCDMVGTVTGGEQVDTHDGFTKDEYKRLKKLQKKLAQAEAAKIQARLDKQLLRKQQIRDLVDPKPIQVNSPKVKSVSEVKIDKPSIDLKKLNATIINLQRQQEQLLKTVELRNQIAQAQAMLAIHEAQMAAERDDEEALLLLLQTHILSTKRLMTTFMQGGIKQALDSLNIVGILPSQLTKLFRISANQLHQKHGVVSHCMANLLLCKWNKALVTYQIGRAHV